MDDRLDIAMADLAERVEFPPTPDLVPRVAGRLREPERGWPWPSRWPRAAVLAVIATLLLAATVAALALVLPGLRITMVPSVPSADAPRDPLGARLALGTPIPIETANAGVPTLLGAPDEAYEVGDGEVLSLVYAVSDDLPELGDSGIGLLVQVIDGDLDRARVEKLVDEVGVSLTSVRVGEADGYWISGPPHLIRYTSPSGAERSQSTRIAGDALVWERAGILFRIESGLGREATIRIAESIAP
jgi:hypothetical protein